jgi:hypothetical protein
MSRMLVKILVSRAVGTDASSCQKKILRLLMIGRLEKKRARAFKLWIWSAGVMVDENEQDSTEKVLNGSDRRQMGRTWNDSSDTSMGPYSETLIPCLATNTGHAISAKNLETCVRLRRSGVVENLAIIVKISFGSFQIEA